MAKIGSRKFPTPFKNNPTSKSRRQPIIIPQPLRLPFYIKGKDVIDWEGLRNDPEWYTLHKRSPQQKLTGYNPLEERATQSVKGSLPERIVYKYLTDGLHFVPDIDFDFQAAEEGGRMDLGGFVVDFVLKNLKLAIAVQGATHSEYLQGRKDQQQFDVMAEFGYYTEQIWQETIYDEYLFEDKMRKIFNLASATGSAYGNTNVTHSISSELDPDIVMYDSWIQNILQIKTKLDMVV